MTPILVILASGLVAAAAILLWRRYGFRLRALRALTRIERRYARDRDPVAFFGAVSRVMRRTAQALAGDYPAAALSGRKWLVFLDETGDTDRFTRGAGQWLIDAPYQDRATLDARALDPVELLAVCRDWVRRGRFNPEHHR